MTDREKIARIIDPDAWRDREDYQRRAQEWLEKGQAPSSALVGGYIKKADEIVSDSLAKADAILALSPPAVGDVERVARAIDPKAWEKDGPGLTRAEVLIFHARRQDSCTLARAAIAAMNPPVQGEVEILRRALCWHGDRQRMATTREEWQQTIDAAIVWVQANPEPDRPSFPTLAALNPSIEADAVRLRAAFKSAYRSGFEQAFEWADGAGATEPWEAAEAYSEEYVSAALHSGSDLS